MQADIEEFRPWLVLGLQSTGTFETIAKFRFRNYAECHVRELNRRMPGYFVLAFEAPKAEGNRYE